MDAMPVNVAIFGGGATGLWLLDALRRAGHSAVLAESRGLGAGQTVSCQGILHSGLKYSLQGLLTAAAREAREMPELWRRCLNGIEAPDLSDVAVLAQSFYLWGTESAASQFGLLGARLGLQVTPQAVLPHEAPEPLANPPGALYRVDEQVISPTALVESLAARHREHIIRIETPEPGDFNGASTGHVKRLRLRAAGGARSMVIETDWVVFAAGPGNNLLRQHVGLEGTVMQLRPLHMVLVRGVLPEFHGHCIDGARTRVSITSGRDATGRVVWQVGGQLSEEGVALDPRTLMRRARAELRAVMPGLDLSRTEWATYRIDRAEGATLTGGRPDSYRLLQDGNVLTAWPTKLVLVPQLVRAMLPLLTRQTAPRGDASLRLADWPRPQTAPAPWDQVTAWHRFGDKLGDSVDKVAA